jgi:drug/metabolite transporter (DMT)-like permease
MHSVDIVDPQKGAVRLFFKVILSYALVYIVWGSTYFFIKLAVTTIPPMYVVGFRFMFGGIGLIAYTLIVNAKNVKGIIPGKRQILFSVVIGMLLLVGGNGMVSVGEKKVDSYIAALIISTVPIVVLVLDRFLLGKRLLPFSVLGAIVGITGTWLLLNKGDGFVPNVNVYTVVLFVAVVSWALGTTLSKKLSLPGDVILNTGIQSLVAGVFSIVLWNFFQPLSTLSIKSISAQSWFSLAYLTIIGSVAFCAYSFLLKHEPNHRVVTYSLVNPVIAVLIGLYIGKEATVPYLIPSCVLILTGLFFLFYGEKVWNWVRRRST